MFGRGVTLFKLLGFEVRLDWSWLIIALLVTWSLARGLFPSFVQGLSPGTYWWMGVVGAMGLFVSIVLHEFGHSIVARHYGIPMNGITLFIFGGVAEMGEEPPSAGVEFLMAIAGPITSIILGGIAYGLRWASNVGNWPIEATAVFSYLGWINLALAAFNLIPAFPLDGGRVLRSILWAARKRLGWATRVAAGIGTGFAFLLMGWGIIRFVFGDFIGGVWMVLIGMFIRGASRMSYREVVVRQALAGEPVARFMNPQLVTVPASASLRELVENYFYRYDFRTFPVVADGHLLGCVTLDQLKDVPRAEWDHRTAQSVVRPCSQETTVTPETDAAKALAAMNRSRARRLMVVDHDRLVGVIALGDLLNFLSRKVELEGV
jgi:Zn-dependent protease/CBS domain-containing protein